MDEKITTWILEFLLRKPSIKEKIINDELLSFPLSNNDNRLKKTKLLREIESEISTGSFSEKLLEFIENIKELDYSEGKKASDSMKEAYCTVAVDCTVRYLDEDLNENEMYTEAVERVWRNRVCRMEELASEELNRWLGDIEVAVQDSSVCEKILMRNTRNVAIKAVKRYLIEAWESLGPAFLEVVAMKVGDFGDGGGYEGTQKGAKISDAVEEDESTKTTNDSHHGASQIAHIVPSTKRTGNSNNVSAVECLVRHAVNASPDMFRLQEALKSSVRELQAAVTDPLPEALRTAENLCSTKVNVENHTGAVTRVVPEVDSLQQTLETNSVEPTENNPEKVKTKDKHIGDAQVHETDDTENNLDNVKENEIHDPKEKPNHKLSLMHPSGTAYTLEWDDSIDNSSESRRVTLPRSAKRSKVEPLQPYVEKKISRERKKWTPQEEKTLRDAVKKFGRRWKFILESYPLVFVDRSDIDLKDKWRNMLKYSAS